LIQRETLKYVILQRETLKYYKIFPTLPKNVEHLTSNLLSMNKSLSGLSKSLTGGGGAAGSAAGALVATMGFAIDRALSFRDRQAQAQAYGLTPYQQAGFGNTFKEYIGEGGAQGLFGGLVQQQTTIGGPQTLRAWEQQYGVKTTGKETQEEQAENVLRAPRNMAATEDPSLWQTMIGAYRVGDVADVNTLMRFKTRGTTSEELEGRFQDERKAGKDFTNAQEKKNAEELGRTFTQTLQDIGKGFDKLGDEIAPWPHKILQQWNKELEELMGSGFIKHRRK
jgi:hypothetical protein